MDDLRLQVEILVQVHIVGVTVHGVLEGGGRVEGDVHVEVAILDLLELDGVIGDVHAVHPGVLQHLAAHVDVQVLLPLDDPTGNNCTEEVGVDDGVVVHLGEASGRVGSGKHHSLREPHCQSG